MADTIDVRASCGHTVWMPKGMMRAPIDNMERRGMCDDCRGNRDDLVAKRAQSETKKAQSRPLGGMKEPKAPNPMDQLGWFILGCVGCALLMAFLLIVTFGTYPAIYQVLAFPVVTFGLPLLIGFSSAVDHHKKAVEQYRANMEIFSISAGLRNGREE